MEAAVHQRIVYGQTLQPMGQRGIPDRMFRIFLMCN